MLRKLTLGLVVAASLGTIAMAPTAASAKPLGFGGGFGYHHHHHFGGIGFVGDDDGCFVTRMVPTPFGYRLRTINICAY